MCYPTRDAAMKAPDIRHFAKTVLEVSQAYDQVDVLKDLDLVISIIEGELKNV